MAAFCRIVAGLLIALSLLLVTARAKMVDSDVPSRLDAPALTRDFSKRMEMIPMRDWVRLYHGGGFHVRVAMAIRLPPKSFGGNLLGRRGRTGCRFWRNVEAHPARSIHTVRSPQ